MLKTFKQYCIYFFDSETKKWLMGEMAISILVLSIGQQHRTYNLTSICALTHFKSSEWLSRKYAMEMHLWEELWTSATILGYKTEVKKLLQSANGILWHFSTGTRNRVVFPLQKNPEKWCRYTLTTRKWTIHKHYWVHNTLGWRSISLGVFKAVRNLKVYQDVTNRLRTWSHG